MLGNEIIMRPPVFECTGENGAVRIGAGIHGIIYAISQDYVVKVPHPRTGLDSIVHEYRVARNLYQDGINVPKPEGVYCVEVELDDDRGMLRRLNTSGFVMGRMHEMLASRTLAENPDLSKRVKELLDQQLRAARDLRYIPGNDAEMLKNYFYDPEGDRVTLIDFIRWGLPRQR